MHKRDHDLASADRQFVEFNPRQRAITLMKSALKLLDAANEGVAAAYLQHAISVAEGEPISRADEPTAGDG